MMGHNSAAMRRWAIVAAASFAIAAGSLVSLPVLSKLNAEAALSYAGAQEDAEAVARELLFVDRMAKCGDSQTPPSIPTRDGEFTIQSVHSRRW